jgi:hypothetical protein
MRRSLLISTGVLAAALVAAGVLTAGTAAAASHSGPLGHRDNRGEVLSAALAPSVPTDPAIFGAAPGGAPWKLTHGQADLSSSGRILVDVRGLVLTSTGANPVPDLAASVYCAGTLAATTAPVPFSTTGNARIRTTLSLPALCPVPAILLNPATGSSSADVKTGTYIGFDGTA